MGNFRLPLKLPATRGPKRRLTVQLASMSREAGQSLLTTEKLASLVWLSVVGAARLETLCTVTLTGADEWPTPIGPKSTTAGLNWNAGMSALALSVWVTLATPSPTVSVPVNAPVTVGLNWTSTTQPLPLATVLPLHWSSGLLKLLPRTLAVSGPTAPLLS